MKPNTQSSMCLKPKQMSAGHLPVTPAFPGQLRPPPELFAPLYFHWIVEKLEAQKGEVPQPLRARHRGSDVCPYLR